MKKPFLTAHWGNLLLLNFPAPRAAIEPLLPPGAELDLFEGSPYVSLVAFQFTRTRVFGLSWPGFTNFPELNLRSYVKLGGRRGVCFVREFVPSALVAGIARALYNEPYSKAAMSGLVERSGGKIRVRYGLRYGGHGLTMSAVARDEPREPAENSVEHFFKEHELGVGRERNGNTVTYAVEHPRWRVFPVESYELSLDAAALYGAPFSFLSSVKPTSVVLAEGSEIVVYGKE